VESATALASPLPTPTRLLEREFYKLLSVLDTVMSFPQNQATAAAITEAAGAAAAAEGEEQGEEEVQRPPPTSCQWLGECAWLVGGFAALGAGLAFSVGVTTPTCIVLDRLIELRCGAPGSGTSGGALR